MGIPESGPYTMDIGQTRDGETVTVTYCGEWFHFHDEDESGEARCNEELGHEGKCADSEHEQGVEEADHDQFDCPDGPYSDEDRARIRERAAEILRQRQERTAS